MSFETIDLIVRKFDDLSIEEMQILSKMIQIAIEAKTGLRPV